VRPPRTKWRPDSEISANSAQNKSERRQTTSTWHTLTDSERMDTDTTFPKYPGNTEYRIS